MILFPAFVLFLESVLALRVLEHLSSEDYWYPHGSRLERILSPHTTRNLFVKHRRKICYTSTIVNVIHCITEPWLPMPLIHLHTTRLHAHCLERLLSKEQHGVVMQSLGQ